MKSPWVSDVTEATFAEAVLERSRHVPVVVDFWAPWCGPCRSLSPVLERLAAEHGGAFELAKVNVDENPALAQAFAIQSIPTVVAVRDGQIVAEFVGALPESQVREFLARLLPSEADRLAETGTRLAEEGKHDEAERLLREALEKDPRNELAHFGLALVHVARGQDDEALALLRRIGPGPVHDRAERLAAEIRVRQGSGGDVAALRKKVEENPEDLEARFELAQACAGAGLYEEALQNYLEIVRRSREFRDDGARKAMVDLFALLGSDHPLTDRYRSELAKVLFR
ncbi:MAG: co-chaperone YbbN [Candidatus Binatia bacterium]|nr:MAG: co-chaperone YbbN [Candidatus Binatia bacterium]